MQILILILMYTLAFKCGIFRMGPSHTECLRGVARLEYLASLNVHDTALVVLWLCKRQLCTFSVQLHSTGSVHFQCEITQQWQCALSVCTVSVHCGHCAVYGTSSAVQCSAVCSAVWHLNLAPP